MKRPVIVRDDRVVVCRSKASQAKIRDHLTRAGVEFETLPTIRIAGWAREWRLAVRLEPTILIDVLTRWGIEAVAGQSPQNLD